MGPDFAEKEYIQKSEASFYLCDYKITPEELVMWICNKRNKGHQRSLQASHPGEYL